MNDAHAGPAIDPLKARRAFVDALGPTQSFEYVDEVRQRLRMLPDDPLRPVEPLRVGIIGNATLDFFSQALEPFLIRDGFAPDVLVAGFGQIEQELLDDRSMISRHRPNILVVVVDHHVLDIPVDGRLAWSLPQAEGWAEQEAVRILNPIEAFCRRCPCQAILFAPAAPRISAWGALGSTAAGGEISLVREFNRAVGRLASSAVRLLDVERIASDFGKRRWEDERYWHLARQPWTLDACVPLAHRASRMIAGIRGKACKVLAVDLDNTLWGGIVGDDGPDKLVIGGGAVGESFVALQNYLVGLRRRGVLLAMLSKNEENAVRAAFARQEMRLTFDDFAARRINWLPKADNLVAVADELGFGLDAFCFLDDNPFERAAVAAALPQVRVVALPDDPALYVRALDDTGWFDVAALSAADGQRADAYAAEGRRRELRDRHIDLAAFYADLAQEVRLASFDARHVERIVQLINKTNQFNIAGSRTTVAEIEATIDRQDHYWTLAAWLKDRFGDSGLIGAMICRRDSQTVAVETFVLSCRAIGRYVEHAMMDRLTRWAAAEGLTEITATYVPTKRNAPAADLFARLGFAGVGHSPVDGEVRWKFDARSGGITIPVAFTIC